MLVPPEQPPVESDPTAGLVGPLCTRRQNYRFEKDVGAFAISDRKFKSCTIGHIRLFHNHHQRTPI